MREERLRATTGLRHATLALSSWRGRSGRRYVVGIHPLAEAEIVDLDEAVVIAVRRDEDGTAHVVDIASAGSPASSGGRTGWVVSARAKGATEMHVHRLAEGDKERRAMIEDLREVASRAS